MHTPIELSYRTKDISGQKFNRLMVIMPIRKNAKQQIEWLCRCDCGNEHITTSTPLKNGTCQSCGCLGVERRREGRMTHSKWKDPAYTCWLSMRDRCRNPNSTAFHKYGGRGITVCDRWDDFAVFLADMGPRPSKKHSIERVDNNGHYCPENCQWATATRQQRNKRDSNMLEAFGESKNIADWSEQYGVHRDTIYHRIKSGWSCEDAISTPANVKYRRNNHGISPSM